MAGLFSVLTGCAGYSTNDGKFVSVRHGFEIRPPGGEPWRRTPDVANLLSLNDPSTSVLYFDNPYSGGVISLQVLPRHYPGDGKMIDELRYIYRRMLSVPYANMRTVVKEKFIAFELSVRQAKIPEAERAEFNLKGSMGRRPSTLAREEARRALEFEQPFGGPRTREEIKAERAFQIDQLTPAYKANYRGKVVVFLRGGTLYEFYYIDHEAAYESGLRDFDTFVSSLKFISRGLF
ncbi:MAG: hypothetical protein HN435_07190 [Nitrospinaceae bacterium]|nr:hypothetical protein [Nitrospinaceae bacterium]